MPTVLVDLPVELQGLIVVQLIGGGDKLASLKALTAWAAIPLGNTCMTQDLWRQACGTVFGLPSVEGGARAFGQQHWRAVFNRLSVELGMLCWAVAPAFLATSDAKPRRWLARFARWHTPNRCQCHASYMDENQTGCSCGRPTVVAATPTLERLMAMRIAAAAAAAAAQGVPPPPPPQHDGDEDEDEDDDDLAGEATDGDDDDAYAVIPDRMLVRSTTVKAMTVALDAGADPNGGVHQALRRSTGSSCRQLKRLLEAGAKPDGYLLAHAAEYGDVDAVQMMLKMARRAGIDMDFAFSAALPQMIKCDSKETRFDGVKMMLDAGVKWPTGDALDQMLNGHIHMLGRQVVDIRIMQMLVTAGATPTNASFDTLVDTGCVEIVQAILDAGAWAHNKPTDASTRRLNAAISMGSVTLVQAMLVAGATPTGESLEKAIDRGHDQIVQMLFRAHAAPIGELLEKAIDQGHAGIVRALLTQNGTLATTEALERASSCPRGGVEIVEALLSAGAQPSAMSLEGASGMRNATVVQAMLDQGATPTDEAFYNACRSGDATVVRMLLKLRVERGLLDICSKGLELAGSGGVVHALLAAGASPHAAFRALCGALYKTHPRMTKLGARVAEARANPIFDGIQKAVIECCGASYCRRLTTSAE